MEFCQPLMVPSKCFMHTPGFKIWVASSGDQALGHVLYSAHLKFNEMRVPAISRPRGVNSGPRISLLGRGRARFSIAARYETIRPILCNRQCTLTLMVD